MGVTLPAQSGLLKPALSGATSTVEGYNPKLHDPFFDGVSDQLAMTSSPGPGRAL